MIVAAKNAPILGSSRDWKLPWLTQLSEEKSFHRRSFPSSKTSKSFRPSGEKKAIIDRRPRGCES